MHPWLEPDLVWMALLGLIFGSFLNVVRVRLPAGESIVHPGSRCPQCRHPLAWWQNIPLLSWFLLRGRCRSCAKPISALYPLIELTLGLLWPLCAAVAPIQPHPVRILQIVATSAFCWIMLLLAALDREHLWLPDRVTWPAIALGLLYQWIRAVLAPAPVSFLLAELLRSPALLRSPFAALLHAALAALSGAAIVLVIRLVYWVVRRREGMGLGDAKLMAALGAWLGFAGMTDSFMVAVLTASLVALLWIAFRLRHHGAESWSMLPLPLGTFLALAAIVEIFHRAWLWNFWMRLYGL